MRQAQASQDTLKRMLFDPSEADKKAMEAAVRGSGRGVDTSAATSESKPLP